MTAPLPEFAHRHLGPRTGDIDKMLAEVGAASIEQLLAETLPASIRSGEPLKLAPPLDEVQMIEHLRGIAAKNRVLTSLIGLGYHDTITPPVIQRNVLENPAWYTAYTPYQPEISQGRLEVLLNFQTMVSDLTGMDVSNASLLDEATAAAEAMAMSRRLSDQERSVFYVDSDCHPQTIAVVQTRAEPIGVEIRITTPADFRPEDAFGVMVQYPGSSGTIPQLGPIVEASHAAGALVVVASDLMALVMLESPGTYGADVVVGSSQRFGVPLGFGGPHAAFIATRNQYVRSLPGRLVGVSADTEGRVSYRLALQTREQHIRREKATSNVCTAQVLLAVISALYASWHGPDGLREIARRINSYTARLAAGLSNAGVELVNHTFFDTLTLKVPGRSEAIAIAARDRGINLRQIDSDHLGLSLDETTTEEIVGRVLECFEAERVDGSMEGIPEGLRRSGEILTHPVFHLYHSEHEMLRYLRRLADRDLALDRTMIPLGSCTMKLNATTEMMPITWPPFSRLHPFAPLDQAAGYMELIEGLQEDLVEITGYDAVSLQPNAGSQGELAGLLAVRAYHRSRGEPQRNVCMIPSSAHGTNAASAVMAGLQVVVVACDEQGNVDLADLEAKAEAFSDRLAAVMITYPSTHGVFEEAVVDLCRIVHSHGGQVYLDGANLNAMVGLARPGEFGADVSHLNLHKTFTIPHGGGGPGVGPIGVKAHLAPFLPNHPLIAEAGPATGGGPVSAAPWGSAGVLPISYSYIRMMGAAGLQRASEVAVLNANYIASRLGAHYPILYTGAHGRVAHECIVDLRPLTRSSGVNAEDVAKRLADYGFHAPTVSFPVAGTLMVEPTESESLEELDRFCEAMISIREEIGRVESGEWGRADNPLKNAPHPAADLLAEGWQHPYSRQQAAYPVARLRRDKYWPPVSRIEGAAGDRNLMCSCPPLEAYLG
jgi:glycine dehydrogenase